LKQTYFTLSFSFLLLLTACSSLKKFQTVDSRISCIGTVGTVKKGILHKEFHEIGQPSLVEGIAVSLQSKAFTKTTFNAYRKYRESQGKKVILSYNDSLQLAPRYLQLTISDKVGLVTLLNNEKNSGLRNYIEDDKSLKILTGISFVTNTQQKQLLADAAHLSLVQKDGRLTLEVHNREASTEIAMKSLEVFDFETSGFCWQENKRNQPVIAVLAANGSACPSGTEKSADKVGGTRQYLKLR